MKGVMRGKLLKKLKSIRQIGYPRQDRVFHTSSSPNGVSSNDPYPKSIDRVKEPDSTVDVSELISDTGEDDDEMEFDGCGHGKENISPPLNSANPSKEDRPISRSSTAAATEVRGESRAENPRLAPLSELDASVFRRPDLNSSSLFDPNLLTAFHQAVMDYNRISRALRRDGDGESIRRKSCELEEPPSKSRRLEEEGLPSNVKDNVNPLSQFEEKCPPGGDECVILYTTSLRGIRKTFEECTSIRFLLQSFRVAFFERDVSMHLEYREELWGALGGRAVPPRLFIKGRHIGGAEVVLRLHEQGKLRGLFEGIPVDRFRGIPCEGCAGVRFVLCFRCNGARKVVVGEAKEKCPECNENGLMICPICC